MSVKQVQSLGKRFKDFTNKRDFNIAGSDIAVPTDEQAQLKQQIESNTTPLGISATYTGASFDTMANGINFNWITGTVIADQEGTLTIQQSNDGISWNGFDTITLTANNPMKINVDVLTRHVRFVLVNGASTQTVLRLYGYATFK